MNILNGFIVSQYKLRHRASTGLYTGLWKYWDFQSEAKVKQIIAIVTTHSLSCYNYKKNTFQKLQALSTGVYLGSISPDCISGENVSTSTATIPLNVLFLCCDKNSYLKSLFFLSTPLLVLTVTSNIPSRKHFTHR